MDEKKKNYTGTFGCKYFPSLCSLHCETQCIPQPTRQCPTSEDDAIAQCTLFLHITPPAQSRSSETLIQRATVREEPQIRTTPSEL